MKQYLILKDFNGSNTGHDFNRFTAGTVAKLSDDLARAAMAEGWAKEAEVAAMEIAQAPADLAGPVLEALADAVIGLDGPVPEGDLERDIANPAELRETKVVEPEETKPAKPLSKMSKAELVTHAKTVHGLELTPDSMTVKAMIEAIEAAGKEA